ncbi:MAG: hypothetical protein AB1696_07165 [Planctomycetota bacterium]
MEQEQARLRSTAVILAAAAIMVVLAVALICVLLLKAQESYRHAAAYSRISGEADETLREMTSDLAGAGNVTISSDGMTMTFQVRLAMDMSRVQEYIAHGSAPPAPTEKGWEPFDVNGDSAINADDVDTKDGNGHIFWGAKEAGGDVWGNFMCYQFQPMDSDANSRPDTDACLDESRLGMDINGDGSMDGVFLPGTLARFSTTEGDPTKAPERFMTSIQTALIGTPTWVIVRWDKGRNRIAQPAGQDLNGDGAADGPIFREMVWWRSKPLNHPLRKPPDGAQGLWDVWRNHPLPEYRHGSVLKVDLWLLRITIDRRHFLAHVSKDIRLRKD